MDESRERYILMICLIIFGVMTGAFLGVGIFQIYILQSGNFTWVIVILLGVVSLISLNKTAYDIMRLKNKKKIKINEQSRCQEVIRHSKEISREEYDNKILDIRYTLGEITKEEFDQLKTDIVNNNE